MITNTPILTDCLSLIGGMLGALCMSGAFVLMGRHRRRRTLRQPLVEQTIEPVVFAPFDDHAKRQTGTDDCPEARLVIARKVELASRLLDQRRTRRWSR
jgi:hypothetical protein